MLHKDFIQPGSQNMPEFVAGESNLSDGNDRTNPSVLAKLANDIVQSLIRAKVTPFRIIPASKNAHRQMGLESHDDSTE